MDTTRASMYRVAISETDTLRKLLSYYYGHLVNQFDPYSYEFWLTPVQAERIRQQYGDKLIMTLMQE